MEGLDGKGDNLVDRLTYKFNCGMTQHCRQVLGDLYDFARFIQNIDKNSSGSFVEQPGFHLFLSQ